MAPLLHKSPAAQFLGSNYFPDGVGISPMCSSSLPNSEGSKVVTGHLQPFYQPLEPKKARCFRPDVMEPDEIEGFPEYAKYKSQIMFLGVRNLILALWNLNPKEWLTIQTVSCNLICRGLIRVRCVNEAERILKFYTKKGIINFGVLNSPSSFRLISKDCQETVLVIGAGPSGLTTAKQLSNAGMKVKVIEARSRIGGRVNDDFSLGVCVGRGAQILTGVINNPFTVMCEQLGISMRFIGERCELFDEIGTVTPTMDQRVDFHFNTTLDAVAEWRKTAIDDVSLYDKFMEFHNKFVKESKWEFSEQEARLLQFHISNLEYACGSSLKNVSAIKWDQNELFPQFAGEHTLLPCGFAYIFQKIASDLDIEFNCVVTSIDYSSDMVTVNTEDRGEFSADKVVVTVPLTVLKRNAINFIPPLPQKKLNAIKSLGSGLIEKIGLKFPNRFWDGLVQGSDFFGHVPINEEKTGICSIFYDFTPNSSSESKNHVLMSYFTGDAVDLMERYTDEELINICMEGLRALCSNRKPKIEVPDPSGSFVSHWKRDPFAGMAYSFIAVGASGESYDDMASDIDGKVFFAGEGTNRQHPQTVTGSYMSGLREAAKIIDNINSTSKRNSSSIS